MTARYLPFGTTVRRSHRHLLTPRAAFSRMDPVDGPVGHADSILGFSTRLLGICKSVSIPRIPLKFKYNGRLHLT